jgi:dihydroorotase
MLPNGTRLTIRRPDDWHAHFRTGAMLRLVTPHHARVFGRAIAMPNLVPPVTTTAMARGYQKEFDTALASQQTFRPLLTCYLTQGTDASDLAAGFADGIFAAAKLYPAHATTNSAHGVADVRTIYPVFEKMQAIGMPLLIHGEVTDPDIDIFDREAVFIERILIPLRRDFPTLKIVMEHITTKNAADYVDSQNGAVGATITPQHLQLNRNDMLVGGIRPHYYCLPILKRAEHQRALRAAATSGKPWYFLGTDSAPHQKGAKESACGCAGVFSAHAALEFYAEVFDEENAMQHFENFASVNGAKFYGLPLNEDTITLVKTPQDVPHELHGEEGIILVPYRAGGTVAWSIA